MILVYVAGAYRAPSRWQVELHIRAAEEHAAILAQMGEGRIVPVVPHTMYRFWDGLLPDEYFLGGTLELLRRCDAVALVSGWEASEGTKGEIAEARRPLLPIPIFDAECPATQAREILRRFDAGGMHHAVRAVRERQRYVTVGVEVAS